MAYVTFSKNDEFRHVGDKMYGLKGFKPTNSSKSAASKQSPAVRQVAEKERDGWNPKTDGIPVGIWVLVTELAKAKGSVSQSIMLQRVEKYDRMIQSRGDTPETTEVLMSKGTVRFFFEKKKASIEDEGAVTGVSIRDLVDLGIPRQFINRNLELLGDNLPNSAGGGYTPENAEILKRAWKKDKHAWA